MALDTRLTLIALVGLLWAAHELYQPQPQKQPKRYVAEQQEAWSQAKILIPRSRHEAAKYYLLSKEAGDGIKIVRTLVERVGANSVIYTLTDVDCAIRMFRVVGELWLSPQEAAARRRVTPETVPLYPAERQSWDDLFSGSSKSDLVEFVCR
jgi:hypothetical protein